MSMKTIFLITDKTPSTAHAAMMTVNIAKKMQASIVILETEMATAQNPRVLEIAGLPGEQMVPETISFKEKMKIMTEDTTDFFPEISEMSIADQSPAEVAELINRLNPWLIIKGMLDNTKHLSVASEFNIQSVVNKVRTPFLLVPLHYSIKDFERMVYMADLRYCRRHILQFMTDLAEPYKASISIAHLSAGGLTDIADTYAESIFKDNVCAHIHYEPLYLNNIRERDPHKALDVIVNGMQHDLLAIINHRFHFEELVGTHIGETMPDDVTIPLLVFPY